MTVGELIHVLKNFEPETPVIIEGYAADTEAENRLYVLSYAEGLVDHEQKTSCVLWGLLERSAIRSRTHELDDAWQAADSVERLRLNRMNWVSDGETTNYWESKPTKLELEAHATIASEIEELREALKEAREWIKHQLILRGFADNDAEVDRDPTVARIDSAIAASTRSET